MIIAAGVQDWTGFVIVRFYFIFLLLCPAVNWKFWYKKYENMEKKNEIDICFNLHYHQPQPQHYLTLSSLLPTKNKKVQAANTMKQQQNKQIGYIHER